MPLYSHYGDLSSISSGLLATQSRKDTSAGYRHYDADSYSQRGYYNRKYYNGDPYIWDYNRGSYSSDRSGDRCTLVNTCLLTRAAEERQQEQLRKAPRDIAVFAVAHELALKQIKP